MGKQKYKDNLFCKVFCKMFTIKDITAKLNYGKIDTITKRFVSFKKKDPITNEKIEKDLVNVVNELIEDNLQLILDGIQEIDPMVTVVKMDTKTLVARVYDISVTTKFIQISMDK